MTRFIGRRREIEGLKNLMRKKSASLVVIKGRRRIGKTRLAEQFGENFDTHYIFAGLAPSQATTSQEQKTEFLRQMKRQGIRSFGEADWGSLFDDVAVACKKGKILVLLDEISWMGHGDTTFLAKLKNSWDLGFKKNPNLILIVSGSNSTWIEKNILNDTGFVGRVSYRLTLEELSLYEAINFGESMQKMFLPLKSLRSFRSLGVFQDTLKKSCHKNLQKKISIGCVLKKKGFYSMNLKIFSQTLCQKKVTTIRSL